ncbi:uncharacterized protein LOC124935068 [Impatiens glandulifera]|uniref:uncharacterized protein LOC124935068 n=1 Tax=Impatiens glandulifera TaxID=253017 RepID=UPI001FB074A7|nr:uncharacterized protein LOC124935068 [Impatiens glandulifera]
MLKSLFLEVEASPKKMVEVSQPDEARFEREPSNDKESEKSSSSEGEQAKNDESSEGLLLSQCFIIGSPKPRPFPDINAANIHDDVVNLPHHSDGSLDQAHKVHEDFVDDEEEVKSESDSEKDGPEQSIQVHTHISPIQTTPADSQDISSNEGSSTGGTNILKSMTTLMSTLQKNVSEMQSNMVKIMKTPKIHKKEFVDLLKTHNEMEQTLKRNTYEITTLNMIYTKFMVEIQGNMSRADAKRLEQVDSFARKIQAEEDVKVAAEKEKNLITQGDDNRGRRGGGVSTCTRSKRKQTGDDSDRRIKRGRGRRGDRGGRSSGSDRGGRSGRGGRSLLPFQNLLNGEEFRCQGFRYPIELLVK